MNEHCCSGNCEPSCLAYCQQSLWQVQGERGQWAEWRNGAVWVECQGIPDIKVRLQEVGRCGAGGWTSRAPAVAAHVITVGVVAWARQPTSSGVQHLQTNSYNSKGVVRAQRGRTCVRECWKEREGPNAASLTWVLPSAKGMKDGPHHWA